MLLLNNYYRFDVSEPQQYENLSLKMKNCLAQAQLHNGRGTVKELNSVSLAMVLMLEVSINFVSTDLIVCLDGFEPGPIYIGPVQVSPE